MILFPIFSKLLDKSFTNSYRNFNILAHTLTKNRLKVRTVIYLHVDNNKNRKSSRRKLGREFPGKTTLSFPNTRFALLQPTGSFSKYLQPCLDSISCAQIHAIRARVREPRDTFRDDRSRKSFHRLFFFLFFCENACVAYVGRSK